MWQFFDNIVHSYLEAFKIFQKLHVTSRRVGTARFVASRIYFVEEDEGVLTVDIMRFSTNVAEGKTHKHKCHQPLANTYTVFVLP